MGAKTLSFRKDYDWVNTWKIDGTKFYFIFLEINSIFWSGTEKTCFDLWNFRYKSKVQNKIIYTALTNMLNAQCSYCSWTSCWNFRKKEKLWDKKRGRRRRKIVKLNGIKQNKIICVFEPKYIMFEFFEIFLGILKNKIKWRIGQFTTFSSFFSNLNIPCPFSHRTVVAL